MEIELILIQQVYDLIKDTKKLSIDLLIQDGKPFIPIARPVIRALNECFKLYEEVVNTYGVPDLL